MWKEVVMTFVKTLANFTSDESGAVTVDWVVLTAAVVGLGIAVMLAIKPAINGLSANIAGSITAAQNTTTP
jgi:Flp pilus assembly pilin Flp